MTVPVAMIPYTNMAPYRQLGEPRGCRFVSLVPKESIAALLSGEVVAAAVPVGGLNALGGVVETVGRFGIAADGESMSVLLFSRVSFEEMHRPRTIRITVETASSVRLLYLLLGLHHGFDRLPYLCPDGQVPDGELLIGDRALVKGQTTGDAQSNHVTDLSRKWRDFYGLPFVFARWVVRKDAPEAVKSAIHCWLEEFKDREPFLVERAVPEAAATLCLDPDIVRHYFRVIRRCLDDRDMSGQELFLKMIARMDQPPSFQTVPRVNNASVP